MSDQTTNANASEAVSEAPAEATVIVENADGTLTDVPVSQLEKESKPTKTDDTETDDSDLDEPDDEAVTTDYWKSRARTNERAKNKALNEKKALETELSTVKNELAIIKHEASLNSIMTEFGLSENLKVLLTASDPEALRVQATALAQATGGKVPAPAAAPVPAPVVVAEQPRFINPLAGGSVQEVVQPKGIGALLLEAEKNFK